MVLVGPPEGTITLTDVAPSVFFLDICLYYSIDWYIARGYFIGYWLDVGSYISQLCKVLEKCGAIPRFENIYPSPINSKSIGICKGAELSTKIYVTYFTFHKFRFTTVALRQAA